MTDDVFQFADLQKICAAWPAVPVPTLATTAPVFERIRNVLAAWQLDNKVPAPVDLTALIRQVLVRRKLGGQPTDLRVKSGAGWPAQDDWQAVGVSATSISSDAYHLTPTIPRLDYLGPGADLFDDAYAEVPSRVDKSLPMDPFMCEAFGFADYKCLGQREALRAMFLMPTGWTLIANLPTGSGKSLLAQAPVLSAGWDGHLTLVVVPTVALALDQARRIDILLARRYQNRPAGAHAYYAGLSSRQKEEIRQAIATGRQGILFAAPESVEQSLAPALRKAADRGFLKYLVIDECHLIGAWGDGFRLAFQSLAGFRKDLLNRMGDNAFKTVLMSATITEETVELLTSLFGPEDKMQVISSVHLRPEPRYWHIQAENHTARERLILDAVKAAPRPLIVYTTKREDTREWHKLLTSAGHKRIACFHGGTPDLEREEILVKWASNDLDIVVATSAFGLGVDKEDVRAVIHATVPEGLDRFYQEVGRGGRDGNAMASLMVWLKDDVPLAKRQASPTLISNELGIERWQYLFNGRQQDSDRNDALILNLELVPPRLLQQSEGNRKWNVHTILLMARAGLLELLSASESAGDTSDGTAEAICRVRLLDRRHLDKENWIAKVEVARKQSFARGRRGLRLLLRILSRKEEISAALTELYTITRPGASNTVETCCGGCPEHWTERHDSINYRAPPSSVATHFAIANLTEWDRKTPFGGRSRLIVFYAPSVFETATFIRAIDIILRNCPIQDVMLYGPLAPNVDEAIRQLLRNIKRPIFLTDVGVDQGGGGYGFRRSPVCLNVVAPAASKPACLTPEVREDTYEVVMLPEDYPDPFHPERKFRDTASGHIGIDEFLRKVAV